MLKFIKSLLKISDSILDKLPYSFLSTFGLLISFGFAGFGIYWPIKLLGIIFLLLLVLAFVVIPFLLKLELRIENKKYLKELDLIELKKKEQEKKKIHEWNKLSLEEKDRILKEKEKNEDEIIKKNKIAETERINYTKKREAERRARNILDERTLKRIEAIKPYLTYEISILNRYDIEQMEDIEFDKYFNNKKTYYVRKVEKEKADLEKLILIEKEKLDTEKLRKIKESEQVKENAIKGAIRKEILEKEKLKKLKSDVINELINEGKIIDEYSKFNQRENISTDIKQYVWERDKGQCVNCGINQNLEFDHVIPFSKGGANTIKNLQLLCIRCNRQKSNKIL